MTKCAIIVTYEPDTESLKQLTQNVEAAGFIPVIVDNSEKKLVSCEEVSKNSRIICLHGNYGIAKAQNKGIEYALSIEAKIIGFFDQDSNAAVELIQKLAEFVEMNGCCVATPVALEKGTLKEYPAQKLGWMGYPRDIYVKDEKEPVLVDLVISSGMMMSFDALAKVGNYDEDFFIDFVDIEWCLRCKRAAVPVYALPDVKLLHKIGNETIKAGGMEITVHSPLRTYYKVRNSFLLLYKKAGILFSVRQILPAVIHNFLLIFKMENKRIYAKYYFKAILHGVFGVKGKYQKGKNDA